jgi:hypothetical protein
MQSVANDRSLDLGSDVDALRLEGAEEYATGKQRKDDPGGAYL